MFKRECRSVSLPLFFLSLIITAGLLLSACGHSTAAFLSKGEDYLQKRKFYDALMQFRSAAESDSGSAKAHWGLARTYEALGQFNETLDELRKTVELDDHNIEAKAKLGTYFLLVQPPMIAEATKLRDDIITADPKFVEGHILTASILAAQGKPDSDVVAQVNKAISIDPKRIESYVSLERLYMTRDNAADAEAAIVRGLKEVENSSKGHTEYGRFLMYANRDADAETEFNKAIAADPGNIDARETMAEFFVTSKQLAKAEKAYVDLVAIQENSPESRLELADFYKKTGRTGEAIDTLDAILADKPDYVLARYHLSEIYLDKKDLGSLDEQLNALFKINTADQQALTLRARARLQEDRASEAITDLEEVLKHQPSGQEPLYLMAQARLAMGQVEQANAFTADLEKYHPNYLRSALLRIQAAFSVGDPQTALRLSNELVAKTNSAMPRADLDAQTLQDLSIRGISSRGLAELGLGRIADAKADLQEVVRVSPHSSAAVVNLAKVSIAERDLGSAFDLYQKALDLDPQNFDAISGVVNAALAMNRSDLAHARINEVMSSFQNTPAPLHYLKSTIFSAEKKQQDAEKELQMAISLDENYLPAYSAYAGLLSAEDRVDEAIAQYNKINERRPSAQAYTMLGILEDGRGNTTIAEVDYRKALEISPDSPIAANNLAWLIADNQGNLDEALQLATTAVAKGPKVAGYYDTLGWVYLQKGLFAPAVEQLKKAVSIDDTTAHETGSTPNPGYRVRLGMALVRSGDRSSAKREVEASMKFSNELSQRDLLAAKNMLASL